MVLLKYKIIIFLHSQGDKRHDYSWEETVGINYEVKEKRKGISNCEAIVCNSSGRTGPGKFKKLIISPVVTSKDSKKFCVWDETEETDKPDKEGHCRSC